jgi:hypothetical protein
MGASEVLMGVYFLEIPMKFIVPYLLMAHLMGVSDYPSWGFWKTWCNQSRITSHYPKALQC